MLRRLPPVVLGAAAFAIVVACLSFAAAVLVQLQNLSGDVQSLRAPIVELGRILEPTTTTTTWETVDGIVSLSTTKRGDETFREWLERHTVAVEEGQSLKRSTKLSR